MARAWRYLVAALVAVAEAAHEKYVIQAFDPAHASAIDAKPPDGFSTIDLAAGANDSTRVSYSVARTGRRKGVAQMTRMRPMNCAGAEALSLKYRIAEPQSFPDYVTLRFIVFEGSHCEQTAPASACDGSEPDLLAGPLHTHYHSYHFILDDTSGDWQDIRVPLCGDEDPLSPFLRGDPFGAAGDGSLDPEFLRGWQLKFVGADAGSKGLAPVTGSIELKDLACEGPGLVRALMEPWEEPVAGAPWRLDAGAAATAAVDAAAVMTYERAGTYALARELPEDAYYLVDGGVSVAYETDGTASFELLGGSADRVVSGVDRGSLTVGADADARITGLALTVAATQAGNTSFTSLRALADLSDGDHAPRDCAALHDDNCAPVDGVVLDEKQATRTIIFGRLRRPSYCRGGGVGVDVVSSTPSPRRAYAITPHNAGHRECCQHCRDDPTCVFFSLVRGKEPQCLLYADAPVLRLAETAADRALRPHWVLGRERRGELCEVCTCTGSRADCRHQNLTTVPFADDDTITSLDLRENSKLGVIPSQALTGLRALEEVLLPVDVKYVAPDAFTMGATIVPAAGTNANVIKMPDAFASPCCGRGAPTGFTESYFCAATDKDAPGADAEFYEDSSFPDESIYLRVTEESPKFGEAAKSAQFCAAYCAAKADCWAFSYWKPSSKTKIPECRMHDARAVLLEPEPKVVPRWKYTAGIPPRTRALAVSVNGTGRGATVVVEPVDVEAVRDGDAYRASFTVRLGAAPTRGAVWVTPQQLHNYDGSSTFEPSTFALYDANTTVNVAMTTVTDEPVVGVSLDVVSCDQAFTSVEDAVHVTMPDDDGDDDRRARHHRRRAKRMQRNAIIAAIVVGCVFVLAMVAASCYYVYKSLRDKDRLQAERRVTVQQQVTAARERVREFQSTFNVVRGDAFLALGSLARNAYHEKLRDAGTVLSFDVISDVEEAKARGEVFVFLSHQWLAFDGPDPQNIQYKAACNAVRAVSRRTDVDVKDLRIWLDVLSIPQKNKALQSFAISSLPTYASACDIFVVIAPPTIHHDTCLPCNEGSYRARAWCRAEVMSCWARNGAETMYKCNGDTLERFDVNAEALDVFGGGLTCCTRGHPDGDPCDKEALVLPMLGHVRRVFSRHPTPSTRRYRAQVSSPSSTRTDIERVRSPR